MGFYIKYKINIIFIPCKIIPWYQYSAYYTQAIYESKKLNNIIVIKKKSEM